MWMPSAAQLPSRLKVQFMALHFTSRELLGWSKWVLLLISWPFSVKLWQRVSQGVLACWPWILMAGRQQQLFLLLAQLLALQVR